jgi:hypothetical protein
MSPDLQRCAVAAAVLGAHAAAVWILIELRHAARPEAASVPMQVLIEWPEPATPVLPAPDHDLPGTSGRKAAGWPPAPAAKPGPVALPDGGAPITLPGIDWDAQAADVAHDIASDWGTRQMRRCDDSDKPRSWLPKCHKPSKPIEWELPRAGFVGGLPYLRLGERCVLVLGLLACHGKADANSHLFDGMNDPDRDRSSVPDIRDINEPADQAHQHPSVLLNPHASPPSAK